MKTLTCPLIPGRAACSGREFGEASRTKTNAISTAIHDTGPLIRLTGIGTAVNQLNYR